MGLPSRVLTGVAGWREAINRRAEAVPSGLHGLEHPVVVPVLTAGEDTDRAVPGGLRLAASWSWRLILVGALIYGLGRIAGYLSEVFIPLAVAILLAAMLAPVCNRLRQWGLPRGAATALTLLGGIILIAGALALITTQIVGQTSELTKNVTAGFNHLVTALQNSRLPINASYFDSSAWGERIQTFLTESRSTIATYAAEVGSRLGHFVAGVAIMLFSLFYFLYDGRGIFSALLRFFPAESRPRVDHAATNGWRALSGYVRATILVAFSDAIGVLIGALIIGVPVAPALAALVFIGAFVPLVGAFVSGFVAVIVALVALGWVQALLMLGVIIAVVQFEGHLLQPILLGRAVKLHPLAVLLAIASGIVIAGVIGALLAVPLLAFTKSFAEYLRGHKIPSGDAHHASLDEQPDTGAAVPDHEPTPAGQVEDSEPAGTDPVPVADRGQPSVP